MYISGVSEENIVQDPSPSRCTPVQMRLFNKPPFPSVMVVAGLESVFGDGWRFRLIWFVWTHHTYTSMFSVVRSCRKSACSHTSAAGEVNRHRGEEGRKRFVNVYCSTRRMVGDAAVAGSGVCSFRISDTYTKVTLDSCMIPICNFSTLFIRLKLLQFPVLIWRVGSTKHERLFYVIELYCCYCNCCPMNSLA